MSVGFDGMGAAYFDGDRPVAEDVSLHIANDNLQIGLDSEDIIFWRLGDIRLVPDQSRGKDYTLRSVTDPLARLLRFRLQCWCHFWRTAWRISSHQQERPPWVRRHWAKFAGPWTKPACSPSPFATPRRAKRRSPA